MSSSLESIGGVGQVDWQFDWTRPSWLIVWLIAAVIFVWFHHRSLSDFPVWQRRVSLAVRVVVAGLLVLALTGLVWLRSTPAQMIVVAIDRSASIDEAARGAAEQWAQSFIESSADDDQVEVRVLPFDDRPGRLIDVADVEEPFTAPENPEATPPEATPPDATPDESTGTDIAAAIKAAAAAIPPRFVPKVVVLSDGNETAGDAVASAASAGMPVYTIALPARAQPEVQLASLSAPAQVRQGEPFHLEVVVNSNTDTTGFVDLYRGDVKLGEDVTESVAIRAGETKFRLRQTVTGQRQVTFAARLRGFGEADTLLDNNEQTAIIAASGRPRILLIDPDTDQTDSLRWALDEQQIDVEVRPPAGVPQELAELQGYECLILSNVPATAMTMRQMDVIRTYVQDLGGGLVMMGGDQSFGLGGYYRTRLEEILPVRSNFEKEREKPSLAMVLVIDKSGSMGGEKIELAKDAARAAVELLGPRDQIGVIAFDGQSYWINKLRSASDRNYVMDQISTIDAGGGTNMYPAMDDAYNALASASAKLKHCIMMTDGISAPGDFERLAGEMAASRMTVSTVALGQGSSEALLTNIARIGGGRYYFCDDPQSIPQVFAKETVEASQSAINELPFLPQVVRPTQVLEGIDWELSPLLLGYVVTRPKPTCEFILASESGDPLLAWWRYGLGMTVAFTSDAKARWAAEWLAWPDFGPFWAQVIRHAMRKQDSRGMFVDVQTRDGQTSVSLDAVDDQGNFIDDQPTTLTIIDSRLKTQTLTLDPVAPGRVEATFPTPERGTVQFELAQTRGDGSTVRQSRGLAIGYPDELRLRPTDETKLRQIAEVSGGMFAADAVSILQVGERRARDPVALWPWLLMSGLALFVVDVLLRRVEFGSPSG